MDILQIQDQLDDNRRTVSFDSYDITVKQLYDMICEGMIDIAPDYQRHFVWDPVRQSALIESLFLGIPVPSLFMATNRDSTWEVIDGLQRLTTVINFIGKDDELKDAKVDFHQLKLKGLDKLDSMNNLTFHELPSSIRFMFLTRPLRITVLNDRSDFSVRYDLFERLNTGGVTLHEQEIRNCVYVGEFNDFIKELATYENFLKVVKMTERSKRSGSYEELVLKFFAYYQNTDEFVHSVKGFLNDYMEQKTKKFSDRVKLDKAFKSTFDLLAEHLPNGIVRGSRVNITPIVLFEAVSVGVAKAIDTGKVLYPQNLERVLDDKELKKYTTGATNSRKALYSRIEIVVDAMTHAAD
ncbi:hypothetical protein BBM24_05510 [Vibrio parahaemolyticus]|uniref:DUF262 domain-containing protein n=3 Tax=Vibrio parahaemolyticus TaxID=670 RepID=UPI0003FB0E6B|nr:DUF262 domain-containing protein [Vibrio parahaemolyticus]EGQ7680551.1 DUF262 domain-containing protein [Vibrio parahaemolyticus]EGQ8242061.1 DUF262 domain-containing protein [Vibrio parahaemolyticus]EGQ9353812.1 DUF262 domain-containing protein [Vibrio parahaemolyticus]EGQ9512773.1 DUF262 domain-containing protein [Vibrio parahaemolyticus]EHK2854846.1 DUF262 domain-containing protein [Vibrio parahaemolyticus]